MRPKILLFALLIFFSLAAHAQHQFRVLHAFGAGNDGAGVWDSVTLDASGNVYGTTSGKGVHGGGTVFRLTPGSGGHWSEAILHNFGWQNDGAGPLGGVLIGPSGVLYGTTETGGGPRTGGIVYSLSPGGKGWQETVLHRFRFGDRAGSSWGNVVMDLSGNLYGTASSVFELSPGANGWTETILHEFVAGSGDGSGPQAGPIRDAAGNLYGTTLYGGGGPLCADGCGTVWELPPPAGDEGPTAVAWTEHILHRFGFSDNDGVWPGLGQLAMDSQGNLYGTAQGGKTGAGIIFKLSRPAGESSEQWRETILYNFTGGADGLMRPRFLLFAFLILPLLAAHAQYHFGVLHAFGAGNDGAGVWDSVTLDASGNVYGTTSGRGVYGGGTVFRLTPGSPGRWTETILHSFPSSHDDGGGPIGGVLFDAKGNLYGTTATLGAHDRGVVFRLAPGKGDWGEEILYSFCAKTNCNDGGGPWGNLITDGKGNLYGTGYVAFELSPGAKGWTETALHDFTGKNGDGLGPQAGPIRDAAGNLYGTTLYGGGSKICADGCGTAWELSPPASDSGMQGWTEHILHRFGAFREDGAFPGVGQLAMDSQGNLYGTANGGKYQGVVYRLKRIVGSEGETWRETILYNFTGGSDGGLSEGVILDKAGNLYGTTGVGGAYGQGVVFKLSPQADGSWKYTLLHTFTGSDGAEPVANLTFGPDGKLYGAAATGGAHGGGVVFQLTP